MRFNHSRTGRSLQDLGQKMRSRSGILLDLANRSRNALIANAPEGGEYSTGTLLGVLSKPLELTGSAQTGYHIGLGEFGQNKPGTLGDPDANWAGTIKAFFKWYDKAIGHDLLGQHSMAPPLGLNHLAWWFMRKTERNMLRIMRQGGQYLPPGVPPGVPAYWEAYAQGSKSYPRMGGWTGNPWITDAQTAAVIAFPVNVQAWWKR